VILHHSVEVLPDADALADVAAARFVAAAAAAIQARGKFIVALSGGETPRRTLQRLAGEPFRSGVSWSQVQVLWGDERCVPPDQSASNYRMAREALLDRVSIPAANVHRIRGEDDPQKAAALYEGTIRTLLCTPAGPPQTAAGARIDLFLLGVGEDGHTASLFPESVALREPTRWVMAEYVAALSMWRITQTLPVINAAAEVLFLVSGDRKAAIVHRVLEGPPGPPEAMDQLPVQAIAPFRGRVHWLVDAAAAAALGQV
jgi:6-phosphogluconolactonase